MRHFYCVFEETNCEKTVVLTSLLCTSFIVNISMPSSPLLAPDSDSTLDDSASAASSSPQPLSIARLGGAAAWVRVMDFLPLRASQCEWPLLGQRLGGELSARVLPLRTRACVERVADRVRLTTALSRLMSPPQQQAQSQQSQQSQVSQLASLAFVECAALDAAHLQSLIGGAPALSDLCVDACAAPLPARALGSLLAARALALRGLTLRRCKLTGSSDTNANTSAEATRPLEALADAWGSAVRALSDSSAVAPAALPVFARLHLVDLPAAMAPEPLLVRLLHALCPPPARGNGGRRAAARRERAIDAATLQALLDEHAAQNGSASSRERLVSQHTAAAVATTAAAVAPAAAFVSPLQDVRLERGKTIGPHASLAGADLVTDDVLAALRGAARLRRLSLAGMCAWSDDALAALLHATAGTLEELDLSRCKQVTDDTLAVIASACGSAVAGSGAGSHTQRLRVLSLAFCTEVTAAGVDALLVACGGGLRLLDLRYVCRDVFFHRVSSAKTSVSQLLCILHC
jgi:hypothetical protein